MTKCILSNQTASTKNMNPHDKLSLRSQMGKLHSVTADLKPRADLYDAHDNKTPAAVVAAVERMVVAPSFRGTNYLVHRC